MFESFLLGSVIFFVGIAIAVVLLHLQLYRWIMKKQQLKNL